MLLRMVFFLFASLILLQNTPLASPNPKLQFFFLLPITKMLHPSAWWSRACSKFTESPTSLRNQHTTNFFLWICGRSSERWKIIEHFVIKPVKLTIRARRFGHHSASFCCFRAQQELITVSPVSSHPKCHDPAPPSLRSYHDRADPSSTRPARSHVIFFLHDKNLCELVIFSFGSWNENNVYIHLSLEFLLASPVFLLICNSKSYFCSSNLRKTF